VNPLSELQGEIGISGRAQDGGFIVQREGPTEEAIDAFILTFRFFVQDNERTSLANIEKLFLSLPLEQARIDAVRGSRQNINDYLDKDSNIKIGNEILSHRLIFDIFLWGDLAHSNPKKKAVYDLWAANDLQLEVLRMRFTDILVTVLNGIFWFSQASREALALLSPER